MTVTCSGVTVLSQIPLLTSTHYCPCYKYAPTPVHARSILPPQAGPSQIRCPPMAPGRTWCRSRPCARAGSHGSRAAVRSPCAPKRAAGCLPVGDDFASHGGLHFSPLPSYGCLCFACVDTGWAPWITDHRRAAGGPCDAACCWRWSDIDTPVTQAEHPLTVGLIETRMRKARKKHTPNFNSL